MNSSICFQEDVMISGIPDDRGQPLNPIPEIEKEFDRTAYNRRRGLRTSRQVRQNAIIREACYDWMQKREEALTDEELTYFTDFTRKIGNCCHHSLFREYKEDGAIEFIGSHTCKHKNCHVCNANRSKKTRRMWRSFFERNSDLLKRFDFMHLTLTVPHTEEGWRGERWYATELMKQFNWMRKKPFWKYHVYGGEFGIEATRNDAGFHIHIHSLLLVHKSKQNRNELHKAIMQSWNTQTADKASKAAMPEERIAAICEGNKLITSTEARQLNPSGATFVGLESLYVSSKDKKRGFHWCDRINAYKRYVRPSDDQDTFLSGIMECMKYHFEPMAMQDNGCYDFELLREILPAIKGKPLYRKFGAFHSRAKNAHPEAHTLSFNYKDDAEEIIADLEDTGRSEVTHPETGKPVAKEDFMYFLVSMSKVYFDPEDDFRIKLRDSAFPIDLHTQSCIEAIKTMEMIASKNKDRFSLRNDFKLIQQGKVDAGPPSSMSLSTNSICLN
ncbi:MAG: hypothetical protein AAFO03_15865 [Bacteroidota bacterium]